MNITACLIIQSITLAYNGVFIETTKGCFVIGASSYGELGTNLIENNYDLNPREIVFYDK